jgi:hypothetical protein
MSTQTTRAHCGACAGVMVLIHVSGSAIWRYRCQECGHETPPRTTPGDADDDVLWVPVKPRRKDVQP